MSKDVNPSKGRKWTIFFATLSVFLLFSLVAALSIPDTPPAQPVDQSTSSQTPQATAPQLAAPQELTYPTYVTPTAQEPASSYVSPTECSSDYMGGMNCTASTANGLQTSHCATNYTGGYICD